MSAKLTHVPLLSQAKLREPLEEAEFRLPLRGADFKAVGAAVLDAFAADVAAGGFAGWAAVPENHEGLRCSIDEGGGRKGWALLRASLHDPLLVLNIESETPGGAARATHAMRCWLQSRAGEQGSDGADASALDKPFAPGGAWESFAQLDCALPVSRGARLGGGTCGDLAEECELQW